VSGTTYRAVGMFWSAFALRPKLQTINLINYNRYKQWKPRTTVVLVVVSAFATGMCLAAALLVATHSQNTWTWVWLLAIAFGLAVETIEATLVAPRNCPT
jgi:hypothetical protein